MLRLTLLATALGTALAHSANSAPLSDQPMLAASGEARLIPAGLQLSGVTVEFTLPADKTDRDAPGGIQPRIAVSDDAPKPVREWEIRE